MIETDAGSEELTRLGSAQERNRLRDTIHRELKLTAPGNDPERVVLPATWEEFRTPEGDMVLIRNRRTRRIQTRVAAGIATVPAGLAFAFIVDPHPTAQHFEIALVLLAIALAIGCGATVLALRRDEWMISHGRLVRQRRFRGWTTRNFQAVAVELESHRDSECDPWFELVAVSDPVEAPDRKSHRATRRTLTRSSGNPSEPRRLDHWIAHRTGLPLRERDAAMQAQ